MIPVADKSLRNLKGPPKNIQFFPATKNRKRLRFWLLGKEKPINIKNFGGAPPGVRPVCPGDTSHLSCGMSRLSRGRSVPLVLAYTQIRPKCPRCPWDVPSLSLGRLRGIPTAKFLYHYVIFLYRFFSLLTIRHENITYPKKWFSNYFPITVSRFRFFRINFRKLPDTYNIAFV